MSGTMQNKAKVSFPKEKIKVLLLENINPIAARLFESEGFQVEQFAGALSEDELIKKIEDVYILGIRSNTIITPAVLEHAKHLLVMGAFCIGTNKIDLVSAASHGVAVFNAPFSNTRSVVELALANIIALNRKLTVRNSEMHAGIWNKSASGCHEIRGKHLGIIGYGNIGSQLSVVAEALGMQVCYYDIADKLAFGNARHCATMQELLQCSDVVSVHVDGRKENENLIGETEFAAMKPGSLFLNLSRGMVVDTVPLKRHLESGHIAGAALDVFATEPKTKDEKFVSDLQGQTNVILTPHVASGTEESQVSIGKFVAGKLIDFINTGRTAMSVNLPGMTLPQNDGSHRLIHIHKNVPGVLAHINTLLAENSVNIDSQYLGTNNELGCVITDINIDHSEHIVEQLRNMPETIRLRILY